MGAALPFCGCGGKFGERNPQPVQGFNAGFVLFTQLSECHHIHSASAEKEEVLREGTIETNLHISSFSCWVTYVTFSEGPQKLQMKSHLPEDMSKPT